MQRQASEQTGKASKSFTSPQSSFLIFVRTGHSAKSCVRRAAGRNSLDVRKGGAVAVATAARAVTRSADGGLIADAAAARAVTRRSISK